MNFNRMTILAVDIGERVFLSLLFLAAFFRFGGPFHLHWTDIIFLIAESFTVILILLRRPGEIAMKPYPVFIALCGTAGPLLTSPMGHTLVSETTGIAIMLAGLLVSLSSKCALNTSFGLVAANRGVKSRWTYSIVRHPIYVGYIITQSGFLLLHPSVWNLIAIPLAWGCQILRVVEEERFLMKNSDYQSYAARVRYRLIPGVI